MQAQSLIQVKIDRPLKEEVSQIFGALGLDVSTAIRMFFQRCRTIRGIPFDLTLPEEKPHVKIGLSKGKWKLPEDWYEKDKAMDRKLESDFYADPS